MNGTPSSVLTMGLGAWVSVAAMSTAAARRLTACPMVEGHGVS